jgi:hypothetical protein
MMVLSEFMVVFLLIQCFIPRSGFDAMRGS